MNDALGFALISTTLYAVRSQFTYEDQPHRLRERSSGADDGWQHRLGQLARAASRDRETTASHAGRARTRLWVGRRASH